MTKTQKIGTVLWCMMLIILFAGITPSGKVFAAGESYTVNFDAAGGNAVAPITVTVGQAYTLPRTARAGYDFRGWTYLGNPVAQSGESWSYAPNQGETSLTLVATWVEEYYLTFDYNGATSGDDVGRKTVYYNEEIGELPQPAKTGYAFVGWYYNDILYKPNSVWDMNSGVQLTARWELATYTITYMEVGSAVNPNPSTYNIESPTITLQPITKTGYIFNGWRKNVLEPIVTEIPTGSTGNITLYADFSLIEYTITYQNMEGITNPNPSTYNIESDFDLISPQRLGYNFMGWYLDLAHESSKITRFSPGSLGDTTLYAKWEIQRITISFDTGDYDSITQDYGTTIADLPTPTREGYTFAGWYSDLALRYVFDSDTPLTKDLTLHAKWNKVVSPLWYWLIGALTAATVVLGLVWKFVWSRKP